MSRNNTEKKNNIFGRMKVTAALLALNIFMFVILGPTEVFYANYSDFDFEFKDFIFMFLGIGALLWILGSVVISVLPDKINKFINALIFAFGLSFYFQNMLLNPKLMGTVGNAMDWASLKGVTISNTIIWIIMFICYFAIAFFEKEKRDKICIYTSIFLILVQIVAFGSLVYKLQGDEYKSSHYKLSPVGEYELAKDENVIILLLDATSERFFEEEVKKSPEILDGLEDFTYYNNYEPCYMTTCPAVSYMWTGHTPDCSVTRLNWLSNAWNSEGAVSFFDRIHNAGYQCRFYTNHQGVMFGDVGDMKGKVDNVGIMNPQVNVKLMLSMLEKYTVYRYVPYILKPRFEVDLSHFVGVVLYDEEFDHHEAMIDYYEHIKESPITINQDLSKLVYYHHFDGIHGPWLIDEEGNRREEKDSKWEIETPITLRGDFVAVKYFLNQLKELGVYDNSTIIISADHGNVFDHTDLQCIFFLKQKNEHHDELVINRAPISADDFRASLLYFIDDEEYKNFGTTYFDWKEGDSRDRYSMIRDLGGKDGFYGYEYNGDGKALYETIMDGVDKEIANTGGWSQ